MTRPDTENSDPLLTQTNPAETKKKNFRIAGWLFLACVLVAFTNSGWSAVMFGLSVAPLETLATQFGTVIVPFFGGWVIARGLKLALKEVPFNTVWIWCVVVVSIGILNSPPQQRSTSVTTSRDTTAQPSAKSSATDAEFRKACHNAIDTQQWREALPACSIAAKNGDIRAQLFVGAQYKNGEFVTQDYAQAMRWFTLAAEQGDDSGQFALAIMYDKGQGVAQDHVRAHMWVNLSAASGNQIPVNGRDLLESKMTREQIAEAQKMARDCVAKNYKGC